MSARNADTSMMEAAQRYRNWALSAAGLLAVAAFVVAAPRSRKRSDTLETSAYPHPLATRAPPPAPSSGEVSTRRAFEARRGPSTPSIATAPSTPLFHLVSSGDWSLVDGRYEPASLDAEGFIHLSTAAQLDATAQRYFGGTTDLMVVEVDHAAIADQLRWEPAPPPRQNEFYPHLYGPLPESDVRSVTPYRWPNPAPPA